MFIKVKLEMFFVVHFGIKWIGTDLPPPPLKPNSSSHVCVSVDFKRFREYCNPVIDEILKKMFYLLKIE